MQNINDLAKEWDKPIDSNYVYQSMMMFFGLSYGAVRHWLKHPKNAKYLIIAYKQNTDDIWSQEKIDKRIKSINETMNTNFKIFKDAEES